MSLARCRESKQTWFPVILADFLRQMEVDLGLRRRPNFLPQYRPHRAAPGSAKAALAQSFVISRSEAEMFFALLLVGSKIAEAPLNSMSLSGLLFRRC